MTSSQALRPRPRVPADIGTALVDPATYGHPDVVHGHLTMLRRQRPLAVVEADGFSPFWLVSKHADILEVERNPAIFRNGDLSTVLVAQPMIAAIEDRLGSPHLTRSLVNMDGQEHLAFRKIAQGWFTPGSVKRLSDRIRSIARTHIDKLLAFGGNCDFVADVALHYPLHVVMDILGVPEADEQRMLVLTQQLFGARDPEMSREAGAMAEPASALAVFQAVLGDFYAYFSKIAAERRVAPREDFASVIANARIDGHPIPEKAANDYFVLTATAGHDTTSASTSGAMWALASDPSLLAQVKAETGLIPALVEEAIRWVTPVKHFMRAAAADYQLGGQDIRAGDWLLLSYLSGNRDEDVFDDPFSFRLDRSPNRQVAFGYGAHVCLGQHLARLEMQVFFEELLPRIRTVELAGAGSWTQSSFVSGPKHLPIRFTPE